MCSEPDFDVLRCILHSFINESNSGHWQGIFHALATCLLPRNSNLVLKRKIDALKNEDLLQLFIKLSGKKKCSQTTHLKLEISSLTDFGPEFAVQACPLQAIQTRLFLALIETSEL